MFAKINCAGLNGIEGYKVEVEANAVCGLPCFSLVGALASETREAQYRVWNALTNSGFAIDPQKITINLSPADLRKDGTFYDLAIAVSVLGALSKIDTGSLEHTAFFGELSLNGELKGVRGILPLCFSMKENGICTVFVPNENAEEASLVPGLTVYACPGLKEVVSVLRNQPDEKAQFLFRSSSARTLPPVSLPDFSEVSGQNYLKRAAEIAASGRHNVLFSGPAGTGKTMIAKRIPGILPELSMEEMLEITKIYSICGLLPKNAALIRARPFRAPHHGISAAAFAGGGIHALPGEVSLASSGILFLDELPLFSRFVLETMREPMEEGTITVTRSKGSFLYPADFQLVAAMNNCACGFYPDRKKCTCSPAQIKAYNGRLSRPLMERIDLCAEASPVSFEELSSRPAQKNESSETIRKRVLRIHELQRERFRDEPGILFNSRMTIRQIEKYCRLAKAEQDFMKEAFRRYELSGRTYHKILKVARTIADMADCPLIEKEHLAEAFSYRTGEERLFSSGRIL